ncbi:MAG: right-handed parallel beta-helix repeat-containing protein [candidate division Zixibacteria bacterium]|nr:right-handed parallel beta-helix repeat-containing protein [candidate division Zixibacteria bacterium]
MKRLFILTMLFIAVAVISLSATIINIPADYATIQSGIDVSSDGDTVLVQPGTYVENINFNGHGIILASLFLISGDTSHIHETIINGDSVETVIKIWSFPPHEFDQWPTILGFTICNGRGEYGGGISCRYASPFITNNVITQNSTNRSGGGIFCWSGSNPIIVNNVISNNFALEGGGLWICYSYPTIDSNNIISNIAITMGGGISINCCSYDTLVISNTTIACNEADYGGGVSAEYSTFEMSNVTITENLCVQSGAGLYLDISYPTILNTIFWSNDASEIHINDEHSDPIITYCDIQGTLWPGEGNISTDPLFCDSDNLNFWLAENSPCVETGQDEMNIGAYGVGCEATDILEDIVSLPLNCLLKQNYPNPFNASTTISYSLSHFVNVKLDVYDPLGRHIETIIDIDQSAGHYQVIWNAGGFPSGIYFYKIQAGDFIDTKKMLLLK